MSTTNTQFMQTLETPRLILRRPIERDVSKLFEMRSDPITSEYLNCDLDEDIEQTQAWLADVCKKMDAGDSVLWIIELREQNETIGTVSFWRWVKEHYRAEIGYRLLPGFWRKGLMFEALWPVLSYGFDRMGLHSVEANTHPENLASRALLEKIGFVLEGHFVENYFHNGIFHDSTIYSLLKSRFIAQTRIEFNHHYREPLGPAEGIE